MAELCNKEDTFRFTLYSRDIGSEDQDSISNPEKRIKDWVAPVF